MPEVMAPTEPVDADTVRRVLALPLGPDNTLERPDATVRDYLVESLAQLVAGELNDEYGLKGDDDWRYDLYEPMRDAGLLPEWEDGWGLDKEAQRRADVLLAAACRALVAPAT